MKRIRLVLAALAIVVAAFAAFSGPAMADDLNCRDARANLIKCDGDLYRPVDNDLYYYWWWNNWWWDAADCPFWGDTTGVVNQWDCFD